MKAKRSDNFIKIAFLVPTYKLEKKCDYDIYDGAASIIC